MTLEPSGQATTRKVILRQKLDEMRAKIGSTPVFELWPGLVENGNRIFVKAEFTNPTDSHYARIYAQLFEADLDLLANSPPDYLVEASSGSAGASFVWFCGNLGFPCKVILPAIAPESFISHINNFNSEAVVVHASSKKEYISGAVDELRKELIRARTEHKSVYCPDHSRRPESAKATEKIAVEYIEQLRTSFGVEEAHYAIVAAGNGATIVGMARILKENFGLHVTAFEPAQAPMHYNVKYGAHKIRSGQHHLFGTGGWGVNIPFVQDEERYHYKAIVDEVVLLDDQWLSNAYKLQSQLNDCVGRTSLASLELALEMAKSTKNSNFLIVFYDRGEKYAL